jgi:hypothetical protein
MLESTIPIATPASTTQNHQPDPREVEDLDNSFEAGSIHSISTGRSSTDEPRSPLLQRKLFSAPKGAALNTAIAPAPAMQNAGIDNTIATPASTTQNHQPDPDELANLSANSSPTPIATPASTTQHHQPDPREVEDLDNSFEAGSIHSISTGRSSTDEPKSPLLQRRLFAAPNGQALPSDVALAANVFEATIDTTIATIAPAGEELATDIAAAPLTRNAGINTNIATFGPTGERLPTDIAPAQALQRAAIENTILTFAPNGIALDTNVAPAQAIQTARIDNNVATSAVAVQDYLLL